MVKPGKVTPWYRNCNVKQLFEQIEVGDLLEFQRTGYAHWAVYIGLRQVNGKQEHCVIHKAVPVDADRKTLFLASSTKTSARVVRTSTSPSINIGDIIQEDIGSVIGKSQVRINNKWDNEWQPKESAEIVARAEYALNSDYRTPYNLITNNCEHFAYSCRYGRRKSHQVLNMTKRAAGSAAAGFAARQVGKIVVSSFAGGPILTAVVTGVTVVSVGIPFIGPVARWVRRKRNTP